MYDEFKAEIAENIARTLRTLRRGGVVSMGLANLIQVTPTPRITPLGNRCGAIRVASGPSAYREMFAEVVAKNPHFVKFTTVETGGAR